jgi:pyruvate formate lyase activating enzyme
MLIKGFQKLSMIDYPGKTASVVFLFGCNFLCNFCHNPELLDAVKAKELKTYDEKEILDYLEANVGFLDGVVVTGGEPTLNPELPEFLKKIYDLGLLIKLDTNGSNPEMLQDLLDKRIVDFLAMDIKAWFENYQKILKNQDKIDIEKIKKSVSIVKKFPNYEFRITIAPGINKEDISKISEYLKQNGANKKLAIQEFRPDKVYDKDLEQFPKTTAGILNEFAEIAKPFFEQVVIRKE